MIRKSSFLNLFLLILASIWGFNSWSQAHFDFHNFNTKDGLPSSEVYNCLQDDEGYMWFATDRGVARYDGFDFKVFTIRDGLTDNVIIDLEKDQYGKIWFVGHNGTLSYWDDYKIIPYHFNDSIVASHINGSVNYIKSVFVTDQGDLILGSVYSQSLKISAQGNVSMFYGENRNVCFVYDRNINGGTLLYTGKNRNLTLKNSIQIVDNGSVLSSTEFEGLEITHTEATKVNSKGFVLNKSKQLEYFQDSLISATELDYYVLHTRYDGEHLWVGTIEGGILKLKLIDNKFEVIDQYLRGNNVSSSYKDDNGSTWITTTNDGVFYLINENIINYQTNRAKITDIALNDSILYISSLKGEVKGWDIYSKKQVVDETFDLYIDEINAFRDGLIVSGQHLYFVKPAHRKKLNFEKLSSHLNISGNQNGPIFFSSPSSLYYTKDLSIIKKIYKGRTFDNVYLESGTIISAVEDGIITVDTLGNTNRIFTGDRIVKLGISKFGLIALSVKNEIFLINDKQVHAFQQNANNLNINYFLIDEHFLWLIGDYGLTKLEVDEMGGIKRKTFLSSDGLLTEEIFKVVTFRNQLVIASKKGVQVVPKSHLKSINNGHLNIEYCAVNGDKLNEVGKFQLSHHQNNMEVVLSTLMLNALGQRNIEYLVNEVLYKTNNSKIKLSNLAPGDYVLKFRLKSSNWETTIAHTSLNFTIKNPFWNTLWFYFVCGTLISFVTFLIVRNLYVKQKQRALQNELLVTYQQKALLAQMNPHFIYNSLNSIQTQVLKRDKFEAHKYISKFGELIRKNLEWSEKDLITLSGELELIELYIDLERKRMLKTINFEVVLSDNIDPDVIRIPPFIIQPIIENSIWHGINNPSIKTGYIKLEIVLTNDLMKLSVVDNGVGIDTAMKKNKRGHQSMSSDITIKRIKLLEEKYNFNSNYAITDLKTLGQLGTKVEFILPKQYE